MVTFNNNCSKSIIHLGVTKQKLMPNELLVMSELKITPKHVITNDNISKKSTIQSQSYNNSYVR